MPDDVAMPSRTINFPSGFVWGTATSGYQVEGAHDAGDKGESIWDRFVRQPGRILHGDTGDVACNAYDARQLDADLDLLKELGVGAYIFSVQWPRIQPSGRGPPSRSGLRYYDRVISGLLQRGIRPLVTLYHWELPQALQDRGGWLARETADRFADYAEWVYRAFGDRVALWVTQNEPATSAWLGYGEGKHAPGLKGKVNALKAAHHLLLSHGRALERLRSRARSPLSAGPVLNLVPFRPSSRSGADRAATRQRDGEQNRLFLDAIVHGRYPRDVLKRYSANTDFSFIRDGDLTSISAPNDFLGINYYRSERIAAGPSGEPVAYPGHGAKTAMGWTVDPRGLRSLLRRVQRLHTRNLPLVLSETGASYRDYVDPEGRCHDPERVRFLAEHFAQARAAIRDGVPLKAIFVWSLLDNFEWDSGYRERFGLVHVDYATQRRVPKDSFHWFAKVARSGQVPAA